MANRWVDWMPQAHGAALGIMMLTPMWDAGFSRYVYNDGKANNYTSARAVKCTFNMNCHLPKDADDTYDIFAMYNNNNIGAIFSALWGPNISIPRTGKNRQIFCSTAAWLRFIAWSIEKHLTSVVLCVHM